jgi:hypothetical protein
LFYVGRLMKALGSAKAIGRYFCTVVLAPVKVCVCVCVCLCVSVCLCSNLSSLLSLSVGRKTDEENNAIQEKINETKMSAGRKIDEGKISVGRKINEGEMSVKRKIDAGEILRQILASNSTWQPDCAHARTKRNEFPIGVTPQPPQPPMSRLLLNRPPNLRCHWLPILHYIEGWVASRET